MTNRKSSQAAVGRAFDRRVAGKTLSFDVVAGVRPQLRERGGTRAWFLRSGGAVPGSGAEAALCPLPATSFERNAWTMQHPSGSAWRRP